MLGSSLRVFSLVKIGHIREDRKDTRLTVATDYLRGPQGCSDLTVFPANPNLDISGRAFSQKTLHEFLSLNRIDPEANVQGTSANHFVVAPPGQVLVRFVDFDIAMILQPRNGDG